MLAPSQRSTGRTLCLALALGSVAPAAWCRPAPAALAPTALARTPFARAEALRATLGDSPTRAELHRVLDAYRAVYHGQPRDLHAAEAVNAVAELLAQQGRLFDDPKSLHDAVAQYDFLRAQYPASPLGPAALVAEAHIERDDLHDEAAARRRLEAVLRSAPHSASATQARRELAANPPPAAAPEHPRTSLTDSNQPASNQPASNRGGAVAAEPTAAAVKQPDPAPAHVEAVPTEPARHPVPLAQVTGIRHWSTPTYTRVAIDLGDEVTFEAARVPGPDRIYFDLHGARLAQELVGKSFEVTDDGFLKRIRAAQAKGDITRVVLDVSDVSDYSAFLLPNPYRLIIDIHGGSKNPETKPAVDSVAEVPVAPAAVRQASAAANTSGLPATAPTDGGDAVRAQVEAPRAQVETPRAQVETPRAQVETPRATAGSVLAPRTGAVARPTPARPVPNTVAVKAPATATEVAALSEAPDKVEATSSPTSKPIATGAVAVRPVDLGRKKRKASAADAAVVGDPGSPVRAAEKTADGETSLVRALGLRIGRIVIDAGHGGHDSGTLGVDGIEEKDVVLDVALRLGKLLHERLGAEVIYTRSDDTFIPLETRTAIANKAQADLFLSIHANSSADPSARGVETYYLNFTSDATALDVAARENAVGGQSIHQLSDLVKKITLKDKIAESREFAADVESSLFAGLTRGNDGLKNRGVKKAPFVVLIGANMPSILAEISFVTNPRDASQLRQPEYRQRVAESLYHGVARYESGLAGTLPVPVSRASTR